MIDVSGLTRSFGDVRAVDDISFNVQRSEIVALLGPNGAGKTTALRMLAGLLKPDAGRALVADHDVALDPDNVRAAIGYHTGDTGLYRRLTPREFLTYFGRLHGVARPALRERVDQLIADLQMSDYADRLCGTLSTGQGQRVSIARTLVHDPPVLILDEPTSGLDIVSAQFILRRLQRARADGRAVLFSTHILSEVELIADRIVIIDRGRVIATDTLEGLLATTGEPNLARAFLQLIGTPELHP